MGKQSRPAQEKSSTAAGSDGQARSDRGRRNHAEVLYPGPFKCTICTFTECVYSRFSNHCMKHGLHLELHCSICTKVFPSIYSVACHYSRCAKTQRNPENPEIQSGSNLNDLHSNELGVGNSGMETRSSINQATVVDSCLMDPLFNLSTVERTDARLVCATIDDRREKLTAMSVPLNIGVTCQSSFEALMDLAPVVSNSCKVSEIKEVPPARINMRLRSRKACKNIPESPRPSGTPRTAPHSPEGSKSNQGSSAPSTSSTRVANNPPASEDTNVAADELSQLRLKELVKRPGCRTIGKPIKLACNYFPLIKLQKGDIVVNRYHIDIQHPRLNDDNRDIFWYYVVKRSDIFGDPFKLAYNGKSTLFTVDKLHLKQVSENADTVRKVFLQNCSRENKPSELSILIKFTGLVHLDFRNAEAGSLDEREKGPVQFLDILFAQGRSSPLFELSKSFKAVRNSFYCIPQGAGVDVKYGIELWRGLFISARVIDGFRPAINIDVSHSCFYKRQSLINLICDILNGDEREVKFHPNQLRLNTADIEGSKSNVAMDAWLPQASYPCGNFSDTSCMKSTQSKGSIGHAFAVSIRTGNQNQVSLCPFTLSEVSVLAELTLGHLRYRLTDVPPQSNSPSDTVSGANHFKPIADHPY
ncbi:putative protein tag-76 [Trichinella murrelli]|uniref:Argonaute linker 1 domain-containing protein n=1 Tax=Trichinella murrelli TaxID=144512 RepID=A0A0V0TAN7_9BILA|nr:putative protein tag-76 [Trichinella murrelli]